MATKDKEPTNAEVMGMLLQMLGSFLFNFSLSTGLRFPGFHVSGIILFVIGMIMDKFQSFDWVLVLVAIISFFLFKDVAIIIPCVIGLIVFLIKNRKELS